MADLKDSISRRGFLATAAMALGTTAIASDSAAPEWIDAHAHVWIDDVVKYPLAGKFRADDLVPRTFPPDRLLELAGKNGVRRVVLIQHQVYHGTDNSYMLDTLARYPGRFSAVAYVDVARADVVAELERLRKAGTRGLRICAGDGGVARWSENDKMQALWKKGPEIGVAMCPQVNPDDLPEVERMCRQFPDTTVVVDHFAKIGHDGMVRPADLDRLAGLARFPNVNAKLSAFYGHGDKKPPYDEIIPIIRRCYESFGPKRLMWASDCPYQLFGANTYEDSIALVRDKLDFVTDEDRQWMLKKTAERVFFT
ncbi:MAG TPA: amidohydrolase family protein [Caulifigura sp.]|nr:amidohydrolase family protein [Caulifigura sp.]